jgi:AcrR family transcriptional regulator
MPKQTFFNLKDEKRQRIIAAAGREFSQHPLYEASINTIIKDAEIPRGSFYQYFEDLPDLYGYYFSLILEDIQENLVSGVRKANGNIFTAVKKYAGDYMEEIISGNHRDFYRNFFLGSSVAIKSRDQKHPKFNFYHSERLKKLRLELKETIDWDSLKVENDNDKEMLQKMIMITFFHAFAHYFVNSIDSKANHPEEVQAVIERVLGWLEFGVRRTEEQ